MRQNFKKGTKFNQFHAINQFTNTDLCTKPIKNLFSLKTRMVYEEREERGLRPPSEFPFSDGFFLPTMPLLSGTPSPPWPSISDPPASGSESDRKARRGEDALQVVSGSWEEDDDTAFHCWRSNLLKQFLFSFILLITWKICKILHFWYFYHQK